MGSGRWWHLSVPLKLPLSPGIDPRARGALKGTSVFPVPGGRGGEGWGSASGTARLSLPLPAGTGGASLLDCLGRVGIIYFDKGGP